MPLRLLTATTRTFRLMPGAPSGKVKILWKGWSNSIGPYGTISAMIPILLFIDPGFCEFYLRGKWVKATPAFNRELCQRHNVPPLEFDGPQDSLFQPYN